MYCVLDQKICISDNKIYVLIPVLKKYNIKVKNLKDSGEVIQAILNHFNFKKEYDIWYDYRIREIVGEKQCLEILETYYKIKGPYNSNELLNNLDIDKILKQWEIHSKTLFGLKFLHIDCQTIDFNSFNNDLKNLTTSTILLYNAVACIINTDTRDGRGKHWICFYIDNKNKKILFFNSSGNNPPIQLNTWFHNLLLDLKLKHNLHYGIIIANKSPIQKSKTECGVWCLVFIKSLLMGYKYNWVLTQQDIPYMRDFRKKLFR